MANVNLQGPGAGQIRDAYQNYLGRSASDDEVSNWLTGAYGWGDESNLSPVLTAIQNSDEAKQRRGNSVPPPVDLAPPTYGPQDPNTGGGGSAPGDQIGQAYWDYLGRGASQGEINNWMSGAYGYGNNLDAWLKAIQGSDEALNYAKTNPRGPQAPPSTQPRTLIPPDWMAQTTGSAATTGTPQDTSFWNNLGIQNGDIYDFTTGQLKPGWFRTQNGYDTINGPGAVKIRQAYKDAIGRDATDQEVIDWLSGKNGWGSGEGDIEKIVGAIYQQGGKTPPPGTTGTTGTTTGPPGGFESWFRSLVNGKPITPETLAALEPELAKYGITLQKDSAGHVRGRIFLPNGQAIDVVTQWGQPWTWTDRGMGSPHVEGGGVPLPGNQYNDQYTSMLESLLKSRIGSLQQPVNDPMRDQYMAALQSRAQSLNDMSEKQIAQLMDFLQKRFTDLQGPGYTGAENEVWRTQALDPIEQDRSAARKRIIERMAAKGHTLESGVTQDALLQVDKAFDQLRGETQTQMASTDLARREDRSQRAEVIGGQLADIPQARAREQLDVFSALDQLSSLVRQEQDARSRESLGYAGTLSDLGPQRLQLAMQAMGLGGSPESLGNSLFNMANLNQNAALLNRQNSGNLWSGLGSIAAILSRSGQ